MLRWRLSLGLVTLMALLIAVGVYAVWLFNNLGSAVNHVLESNYKNVRAINQILVATSRINGIYLAAGAGNAFSPADRTAFADNRAQIAGAIRLLEDDAAASRPPDEMALLHRFDAVVHSYFDLSGQLLQAGPGRPAEERVTPQRIHDSTFLLAELAEQILHANENAMSAADRTARSKSSDSIHFMLVAMSLALIISLYASYRLGQSILDPIHLLTEFTGKIGSGDLDITVPVISQDELGKLASSFNKMAGQLRAYRQSTTEKIFTLNRTMEATLSAFPDPVFVLDHRRQVTLCNPAAQRFAEELGFTDRLPPELQTRVAEVSDTQRDYLPATFKDALYYRIADQEQSFLPRVLVMRNPDRTLHGVAIVLQDITRFRLLDDVKTNLVSTVSHELRTPLTSIRMALHILLEKKLGELTPKQSELLVVARDDSERLLRTLNDLLDLSQLEDSSHDLHYDMTAPAEILQEAAHELREAAGAAQVRIELDLEPGLPEVPMDRIRMKHVFTNFLDNAVKHSAAGARVVLRARRIDARALRFSVIDEGEGIPPEYQGRLFDKFFRVPGQPRTGAGLGLSIVRQIVQAHRGQVGVSSELGRGSEFYCDIPVEDGQRV
jgi:NtrC-family two-component system sensor histidine kinase KinB